MNLSPRIVAETAIGTSVIRAAQATQTRWVPMLGWFCLGAVLACGLANAVAVAPLAWRGWAYLALHGILTLLMLGAWLSLHQQEGSTAAAAVPDPNIKLPSLAQSVRWLLIAGVVCRLLLFAVPAFTTHDVQRYLWDGAVALSGLDPYRIGPDAATALPLRMIWPTPAEHAAYPTLYPPAALALFAFSALAGPSAGLWMWKALLTAASIGTLLLGYRWLERRGTPQYLPLLALSPLLLLETGVGAHVDGFSTLAVVAALSAFEAGRLGRVGFWIGLGALVKLLPLVLLLPLGVAALARREWVAACVMTLTALGTLVLLDNHGQPLFSQIIVVDNASSDATAQPAQLAGARVVQQPERGYGAACLAGIAAAPSAGTIVFIDGDASVDLNQTADLLAPLQDGADLLIGARHELLPGAMGLPQRIGNILASALIRLLWQKQVSDLGPFRAMRGSALRQLGMQDRRFGWTVEMQVRAIQQGLIVTEVPVRVLPRIGHSKISGTFKGVLGAAHGIFSTIAALWFTECLARFRSARQG